MAYIDSGKKVHAHPRLVLQLSKYQGANIPKRITMGKTSLIQKGVLKKNHPQQLSNDNISTNDVENLKAKLKSDL